MIHITRPKRFKTSDTIRERGRLREIVIEVHPGYAMVRLAKMRTAYSISYESIYRLAVRLQVEKERAEKKSRTRSRLLR